MPESAPKLPATPESNRWQFHRDSGHAREHVIVVPAVFAQRLERQRHELKEKLNNLNAVVTGEWESKDAFVARVRAILFPPQNDQVHQPRVAPMMPDSEPNSDATEGCAATPCSACGVDPFVMQAAKAAVNTLVRDNERMRDRSAQAENEACLLELTVGMMEQDIATIREIIAKGGTAADILKFLDTEKA